MARISNKEKKKKIGFQDKLVLNLFLISLFGIDPLLDQYSGSGSTLEISCGNTRKILFAIQQKSTAIGNSRSIGNITNGSVCSSSKFTLTAISATGKNCWVT